MALDGEKFKGQGRPDRGTIEVVSWSENLITNHLDRAWRIGAKEIIDETIPQRTTITQENPTPLSRRDTLAVYGDTTTDYFWHAHLLNRSGTTTWENQDPIVYGFEIVIDAISSPLLNGAVLDFIKTYPYVSEIQMRNQIYRDFIQQFKKIFKTKGKPVERRDQEEDESYQNISDTSVGSPLAQYAKSNISNKLLTRGKPAYLSHYLKKITGLHKLSEANTPSTKKYLVDYRNDLITLSFDEDITGTMAALAHLYKLLYWSKPHGKGIVPENLLRFNCDIIVSECRNFKRVMRNAGTKRYEEVKDNVSRHIYSLKECQFYFDKMPHEDTVDMEKLDAFEKYDVSFDFKYSTLNFERWIPDKSKFGKYVGYNNGAIWKAGNAEYISQNIGNIDAQISKAAVGSVPKAYTNGKNTLNQPGVRNIFTLEGNVSDDPNEEDDQGTLAPGVDQSTTKSKSPIGDESDEGETKKAKNPDSSFEKFKRKSKNAAILAGKNVLNATWEETKNQWNARKGLFTSTLAKVKRDLGIGYGLGNVNPVPYAPRGMGIYFDVRNDLLDFINEDIATTTALLNGLGDPWASPWASGPVDPVSTFISKFRGPSITNPSNLNSPFKKK